MFESYYNFEIGEDYYNRIYDMTPATLNREHKHTDVESGLNNYTYNWECIAQNSEYRRGSAKLYLINDEHYICCSRTGMEKAGNSIQFSKSCPEKLRYEVWSSVFEHILERKFGSIKNGIDKESIINNAGAMSLKTFVLANKLSPDELRSYFDDMADLIIQLIEKYHTTNSTSDIEEIVTWYHEQSTLLYRDYTNFTPTMLSQVLNNIEERNGWVIPSNVDGGKRFSVIIHEDYTPNMEDGQVMDIYTIEIDESVNNEVNLVHENNQGETILEEKTYETKHELQSILEEWLEITPTSN